MSLSHRLVFLARVLIGGLALAFVILLVRPQLIAHGPTVVIRESAPSKAQTQGPVSYAYAVKKAANAVVNINTAKVVVMHPSQGPGFPFFAPFPRQQPPQGQKRVETSLGSGVIISTSGYILTNYHVIRGADAIRVFLKDGRSAKARVVGVDPATDLAVLKIHLRGLTAITLGHTSDTVVGEVVLAIGDPFGIGQTVTMGIVSATGRDELGLNPIENFIQTDAAINPGNSGGALINTEGHLIGIDSAIYTHSGGFQGIGFAIPVNLARHVFRQIVKYGHVIEGWVGVAGQTLTPALARALKLPTGTRGVVVAAVYNNGPAAQAGIRPGDVIYAINGRPLRSANRALLTIADTKPGTPVTLGILRTGRRLAIRLIVGTRPPLKNMASVAQAPPAP
ncbi:trypsin-like peptidase domain-containing protein [Acidiferrobacter sp.]|uniref:S1C family serine protease n=1 Tax=Acidiferrobacter sp. TaxID=1872107 RepID=UPI00263439BC|nr:trypsin-like peptidase domain-containing protein [Acidiferrobacter sp.]